MQRTGRSANKPRRPSNGCNSPGLNWTELQRGHMRRNHSTRGSQFGQTIVSTFIPNFLSPETASFPLSVLWSCTVAAREYRSSKGIGEIVAGGKRAGIWNQREMFVGGASSSAGTGLLGVFPTILLALESVCPDCVPEKPVASGWLAARWRRILFWRREEK
jgi:hypothetical protein